MPRRSGGPTGSRASSEPRFVALRNEYSLLRPGDDAEVLPLCGELGIGYLPYFPLASGLLTGKYRRGEPAPERPELCVRAPPQQTGA